MEVKITLRNWFVKDTEKTQHQTNSQLNSMLKILSFNIMLFLIQGIGMTYLRDYQFKRNMEIIEPFLTERKINILNQINKAQYLENVSVLILVFIIGIISLYYCNYKYDKYSMVIKDNQFNFTGKS